MILVMYIHSVICEAWDPSGVVIEVLGIVLNMQD